MATLPLEVHEVLEEEYASMYGVAPADYDAFEIRDAEAARTILRDRGIGAENVEAALVNTTQKPTLEKSPALSPMGRMILKDYDSYADENSKKLNRRIVDEALCGAIKSYRDMELERIYAALHDRPDDEARTALCIS